MNRKNIEPILHSEEDINEAIKALFDQNGRRIAEFIRIGHMLEDLRCYLFKLLGKVFFYSFQQSFQEYKKIFYLPNYETPTSNGDHMKRKFRLRISKEKKFVFSRGMATKAGAAALLELLEELSLRLAYFFMGKLYRSVTNPKTFADKNPVYRDWILQNIREEREENYILVQQTRRGRRVAKSAINQPEAAQNIDPTQPSTSTGRGRRVTKVSEEKKAKPSKKVEPPAATLKPEEEEKPKKEKKDGDGQDEKKKKEAEATSKPKKENESGPKKRSKEAPIQAPPSEPEGKKKLKREAEKSASVPPKKIKMMKKEDNKMESSPPAGPIEKKPSGEKSKKAKKEKKSPPAQSTGIEENFEPNLVQNQLKINEKKKKEQKEKPILMKKEKKEAEKKRIIVEKKEKKTEEKEKKTKSEEKTKTPSKPIVPSEQKSIEEINMDFLKNLFQDKLEWTKRAATPRTKEKRSSESKSLKKEKRENESSKKEIKEETPAKLPSEKTEPQKEAEPVDSMWGPLPQVNRAAFLGKSVLSSPYHDGFEEEDDEPPTLERPAANNSLKVEDLEKNISVLPSLDERAKKEKKLKRRKERSFWKQLIGSNEASEAKKEEKDESEAQKKAEKEENPSPVEETEISSLLDQEALEATRVEAKDLDGLELIAGHQSDPEETEEPAEKEGWEGSPQEREKIQEEEDPSESQKANVDSFLAPVDPKVEDEGKEEPTRGEVRMMPLHSIKKEPESPLREVALFDRPPMAIKVELPREEFAFMRAIKQEVEERGEPALSSRRRERRSKSPRRRTPPASSRRRRSRSRSQRRRFSISRRRSPRPSTIRWRSPRPSTIRRRSPRAPTSRRWSPRPSSIRWRSPRPSTSRRRSPLAFSSRRWSAAPPISRRGRKSPQSSRRRSPIRSFGRPGRSPSYHRRSSGRSERKRDSYRRRSPARHDRRKSPKREERIRREDRNRSTRQEKREESKKPQDSRSLPEFDGRNELKEVKFNLKSTKTAAFEPSREEAGSSQIKLPERAVEISNQEEPDASHELGELLANLRIEEPAEARRKIESPEAPPSMEIQKEERKDLAQAEREPLAEADPLNPIEGEEELNQEEAQDPQYCLVDPLGLFELLEAGRSPDPREGDQEGSQEAVVEEAQEALEKESEEPLVEESGQQESEEVLEDESSESEEEKEAEEEKKEENACWLLDPREKSKSNFSLLIQMMARANTERLKRIEMEKKCKKTEEENRKQETVKKTEKQEEMNEEEKSKKKKEDEEKKKEEQQKKAAEQKQKAAEARGIAAAQELNQNRKQKLAAREAEERRKREESLKRVKAKAAEMLEAYHIASPLRPQPERPTAPLAPYSLQIMGPQAVNFPTMLATPTYSNSSLSAHRPAGPAPVEFPEIPSSQRAPMKCPTIYARAKHLAARRRRSELPEEQPKEELIATAHSKLYQILKEPGLSVRYPLAPPTAEECEEFRKNGRKKGSTKTPPKNESETEAATQSTPSIPPRESSQLVEPAQRKPQGKVSEEVLAAVRIHAETNTSAARANLTERGGRGRGKATRGVRKSVGRGRGVKLEEPSTPEPSGSQTRPPSTFQTMLPPPTPRNQIHGPITMAQGMSRAFQHSQMGGMTPTRIASSPLPGGFQQSMQGYHHLPSPASSPHPAISRVSGYYPPASPYPSSGRVALSQPGYIPASSAYQAMAASGQAGSPHPSMRAQPGYLPAHYGRAALAQAQSRYLSASSPHPSMGMAGYPLYPFQLRMSSASTASQIGAQGNYFSRIPASPHPYPQSLVAPSPQPTSSANEPPRATVEQARWMRRILDAPESNYPQNYQQPGGYLAPPTPHPFPPQSTNQPSTSQPGFFPPPNQKK